MGHLLKATTFHFSGFNSIKSLLSNYSEFCFRISLPKIPLG